MRTLPLCTHAAFLRHPCHDDREQVFSESEGRTALCWLNLPPAQCCSVRPFFRVDATLWLRGVPNGTKRTWGSADILAMLARLRWWPGGCRKAARFETDDRSRGSLVISRSSPVGCSEDLVHGAMKSRRQFARTVSRRQFPAESRIYTVAKLRIRRETRQKDLAGHVPRHR